MTGPSFLVGIHREKKTMNNTELRFISLPHIISLLITDTSGYFPLKPQSTFKFWYKHNLNRDVKGRVNLTNGPKREEQ